MTESIILWEEISKQTNIKSLLFSLSAAQFRKSVMMSEVAITLISWMSHRGDCPESIPAVSPVDPGTCKQADTFTFICICRYVWHAQG